MVDVDREFVLVGVDPGSRHTGLVVVHVTPERPRLLAHTTVERVAPCTDARYAASVCDALTLMHGHVQPCTAIAVEGLRSMGRLSNATTMMSVGFVVGWLMRHVSALATPSYVVPPAHHGLAELGLYPAALVSQQERQREGWERTPGRHGKLRHERSAWDVAMAGAEMHVAALRAWVLP